MLESYLNWKHGEHVYFLINMLIAHIITSILESPMHLTNRSSESHF